jgi:mRNA-degrading endonuclease RelE of RelBE toxin-antitoxin system
MPLNYKLRVADGLADFIRGTHPELKRKIKSALKHIFSDPHSGKHLRDELYGLMGYKVGRFRIIYRLAKLAADHVIEIVATGPRRGDL